MIPFVAIAVFLVAVVSLAARESVPFPWKEPAMDGNQERTDYDALYPWFRVRLEAVEQQMRSDGFGWTVRNTSRTLERQRYYYDRKESKVLKSYHTVTGADGRPEAFAADVHDSRYPLEMANGKMDPRQAPFFVRLRNVAREHQLRTGAEFSQDNPDLAQYGLGWDPGHIEPAPGITSIDRLHKGERPNG